MVIKLRVDSTGSHVRATVFVGPDVDHLAGSGELCFRHDEWMAFSASLVIGAETMNVNDPDPTRIIIEGDERAKRMVQTRQELEKEG